MLQERDDGRPDREPILNTPALVAWTIGILAGIFLIERLLPDESQWALVSSFGVVPGRYFGAEGLPVSVLPGAWGRLLPLLTYSLLHGSPIHLLLNVVWLLAIGTPVAQRLGAPRFLLFWAVTAIAAALFYILLKTDSPAPMIGASGAISGLFGGLARFMFTRPAAIQVDGSPSESVFGMDRRVLFFAVTWLALNMVVGLSGFGTEEGASAIAWEAHAGGFMAGLLLFPFFDRSTARIA